MRQLRRRAARRSGGLRHLRPLVGRHAERHTEQPTGPLLALHAAAFCDAVDALHSIGRLMLQGLTMLESRARGQWLDALADAAARAIVDVGAVRLPALRMVSLNGARDVA